MTVNDARSRCAAAIVHALMRPLGMVLVTITA